MKDYWVFQDNSFKRACIHRSGCKARTAALEDKGAASKGTWHGAYPSYDEARRGAAVMAPQKGAQLNCRLCHPEKL
jgi:hypothetical protein